MSRNWNMSKCRDVDGVTKNKDEWPISESLIMGTMVFDLGHIDEKNIDEWLWRIAFCQEIGYVLWWNRMKPDGSALPGAEPKMEPWWPSYADLERRIGMYTNVHTKTRRQWCLKMLKLTSEAVDRSVRRQKEQLNEKKEAVA